MTNSEYSAKRYHDFKAAGRCPGCGNPVDREGVYCQKCVEYFHWASQKRKRVAQMNRAAGLCACGAETDGIHKRCERCRKLQNLANKRYLEKKKGKGKMKMKVVLDPGAYMPTRAHEDDAGLDLYSREDVAILPKDSHCFDTGVHMAIPAGYVGMIKSKSGLNVNHNMTSEGVIDAGYTGSIAVKLYNHGNKIEKINAGQKISQLVILPIIAPEIECVDSLEATERGTGGFGSTGRF